jgi:uncharacterized membrane protein YidH (DUF202 family)
MKNVAKYLPFGVALLPVFAFGQATDLGFLTTAVNQLQALLQILLPLLIGLGLIFFVWGLVTYILASGDEAAKEEGKRKMIWGIVALFIIVSVWGIVAILQTLFGVNVSTAPTPPGLP